MFLSFFAFSIAEKERCQQNSSLEKYVPNTTFGNTKPAVVFNFSSGAGASGTSKGVFLFSVMGNGLPAPLIVACSWRMYEFEQGTKKYNTWETFLNVTKIVEPTNASAYFQYIRIRIPEDKKTISVVIREIPEFSSVFCISANGLKLINITEES